LRVFIGVCVCVCVITVTVHETHNTVFFLKNKSPLVSENRNAEGHNVQLMYALGRCGFFICPPGLTFSNSAFCPKRCIYVFCKDLRTNSD